MLNFFKINSEDDLFFPEGFFDVCVMNDVIEHVEKKRCYSIFKALKRITRKGGIIFIHTSPGKLFLNYGLKIYRLIGYFTGFKFDKHLIDLLPNELKPPYHVSQWSVSDIKRSLKLAGFKKVRYELWKNPHYAYYFTGNDRFLNAVRIVSKVMPFKELFYADIFVYAQS